MNKMNYQEIENYINQIPRFSKKKSEENCRQILAAFGHPEKSFHYIHVAGTNGKGSVCAYLDCLLRSAGKKTGLFTSPHLITTTERMKIDGHDISQETFVEVFDDLMELVKARQAEGHPHPTYFEFLYLMAMIWFGREGIEYGVIETGLGGRLDATNLIESPALTLITSISYDHMEILGDTIEKIAAEKAGIIKKGVPLVCDGKDTQALSVLREEAQRKQAPFYSIYPEQVKLNPIHGKNIDFSLQSRYDKMYDIHLNTPAVYQAMNSSLALTAFILLREQDTSLMTMSEKDVIRGLGQMHWPGRLEEILPDVYVDGAHNPGGISELVESMNNDWTDRPLVLVFAVASDKDYAEMIRMLTQIRHLEMVVLTEIDNSRRTDLGKLEEIFHAVWQGKVCSERRIEDALILGQQAAEDCGGILLCAGSLYLAGSVLETLKGR